MYILSSSTEINEHIKQDTIFLCCASFEDRCFSVANIIDKSKIFSSYVFQYVEFSCHTDNNAEKLKAILGCNTLVPLSNSDPLRLTDAFISTLNTIEQSCIDCNILVDITTFTREGLLILIKLLKSRFINRKVDLIYNSASEMSADLSMGPRAFRSILGYSGLLSPSKKNHLVIIFGYEVDRARAIIDDYEPELISIGTGSKSFSIKPELHERNLDFFDQLSSYYSDSLRHFEVSVRNPDETLHDLRTYSSNFDYDTFNIIISPMNTKLSTVGTGLFAIENPKIQLCYSEMSLYNFSSFSLPSNEFYLYSL